MSTKNATLGKSSVGCLQAATPAVISNSPEIDARSISCSVSESEHLQVSDSEQFLANPSNGLLVWMEAEESGKSSGWAAAKSALHEILEMSKAEPDLPICTDTHLGNPLMRVVQIGPQPNTSKIPALKGAEMLKNGWHAPTRSNGVRGTIDSLMPVTAIKRPIQLPRQLIVYIDGRIKAVTGSNEKARNRPEPVLTS